MKERLPREIELMLPPELVHLIQSFLPPMPPKAPPPSPATIRAIQKFQKAKHPSMQMFGLEDFLLDGK